MGPVLNAIGRAAQAGRDPGAITPAVYLTLRLDDDGAAAECFFDTVDSAILLHNASTQYADGGEFGMGAEIGISTQKLHARGPMALPELTSYKWVVRGDGQIRVSN